VPEELSEAYLKSIAHSLLRQGFSAPDLVIRSCPSDQFVAGMIRQFFEETKDPILYIHVPYLNRRVGRRDIPKRKAGPRPGRTGRKSERLSRGRRMAPTRLSGVWATCR